MNSVRIINLKENPDQALNKRVIQTWEKYNMLPSVADAEKRVKQVIFVAMKGDQVIGITTAYPVNVAQLNNNLMFAYRGMTAPDLRIPGLIVQLTKLTFEYLEKGARKKENWPLGLIMEMENQRYRSIKLTTTPNEFSLMGFSQRGNPIYVKYFKRVYYK